MTKADTPDFVFTALCCRRMRPRLATVMLRDVDRYTRMETLQYQCEPGRGCKQWN